MKREKDYKEELIEYIHENSNHFWFHHRNKVILDMIVKHCKNPQTETHILELGAGSGIIGYFLKTKGYKVDVSDMYESATKYSGNEIDNAFTFDLISDKVQDIYKNKYDVVILGDVIEHLDNPVSALKKACDFLTAEGYIVITVPALKRLWTPYDKFSGHKKRYSRMTLKNELICSKYYLVEIKYFMFLPAIILLFQRKLKSICRRNDQSFVDELKINKFVNKIMSFIMLIEYNLENFISCPFGSSLIAIGKKI